MAPPPPPGSRDFTATAGWSAGERRLGTQCLRFLPRHAPFWDRVAVRAQVNGPRYRRSPSPVPCKSSRPGSRRLYAGHHLANKRVTRQACPRGKRRPPGFGTVYLFRRFNNDVRPNLPGRTLLARLPGPHLTRSRRAFSLSLTTTVFSQRSTGWFGAYPRRPTPEGQQSSISRTAPPIEGIFYTTPPSAFVTHYRTF